MFCECSKNIEKKMLSMKKKVDRKVQSYHVFGRTGVSMNSPKDSLNPVPIPQVDELRQKEVKEICPKSLR